MNYPQLYLMHWKLLDQPEINWGKHWCVKLMCLAQNAWCLWALRNVTAYYNVPNILLFSVAGQNISVTKHIKIRTASGSKKYHLKGIVYHGAFHFTSRIVTSNSLVWIHDGQLGANCQYENHLNDYDGLELCSCGTRQMSLVFMWRTELIPQLDSFMPCSSNGPLQQVTHPRGSAGK